VGAAIVLHAISFVPVTIVGIMFMAREGLTLGGARKLAAERSEAVHGGGSPLDRQRIEAEGRAR
jgi:hypothetical protein